MGFFTSFAKLVFKEHQYFFPKVLHLKVVGTSMSWLIRLLLSIILVSKKNVFQPLQS